MLGGRALNSPPATQWRRLIRPLSLRWGKRAWQLQMMRAIFSWVDDVGLLAANASTSALTADAVPWSGLREGRGRGFGGDPCGRSMVMRDLMLGPGEATVLYDLTLW